MQIAMRYREKAAEMERYAATSKAPADVAHWTRMAVEWTAMARRAEREDRFLGSPKG